MAKSKGKRKFTPEHKAALSKSWEKRRKRPLTEVERAAYDSRRGKPRSEETKQKIRDGWARRRERLALEKQQPKWTSIPGSYAEFLYSNKEAVKQT
jgi:hypothetical protein